jgi:hypothetical protein
MNLNEKAKFQPRKSPLIQIKIFNKLFDLNFLLQVMYAKNEFLTKSMSADSNYFSDFEFKLLHTIKSKSPIKQFPKITFILPEVLIIKTKP